MSKRELVSLEDLVGHKIRSVHLRGEFLYILTEDNFWTLEPTGDCCAHCYIQHIAGSFALDSGAIVIAVELIELPGVPEENLGDETTEVWGHKIVTTKGHCNIEMRVDHNGYYSGWLDVFKEPVTSFKWPEMHEDCLKIPGMAKACGCGKELLEDF